MIILIIVNPHGITCWTATLSYKVTHRKLDRRTRPTRWTCAVRSKTLPVGTGPGDEGSGSRDRPSRLSLASRRSTYRTVRKSISFSPVPSGGGRQMGPWDRSWHINLFIIFLNASADQCRMIFDGRMRHTDGTLSPSAPSHLKLKVSKRPRRGGGRFVSKTPNRMHSVNFPWPCVYLTCIEWPSLRLVVSDANRFLKTNGAHCACQLFQTWHSSHITCQSTTAQLEFNSNRSIECEGLFTTQ